MPLFLAEFRVPNMSNVIACTSLKIIANSVGVAKPMKKQIYYALKLKKINHVCTHSSVQIVEAITRQTPIYVHSRSTGSIANGIRKSISRSVKTEQSQFILLRTVSHNDLWHFKNLFSKYLQKLSNCQHYSRDSNVLWYYFHSRTFVVDHSYNSELYELWRRGTCWSFSSSQLAYFCQILDKSVEFPKSLDLY